jgi:CheY-like chemotaxis protein
MGKTVSTSCGGKAAMEAKRPDLLLLDLNLPRMSGDQVLLAARADPQLRGLPIIVFTSAANEVVCTPIYQDNANTCIREPSNLDEFYSTI